MQMAGRSIHHRGTEDTEVQITNPLPFSVPPCLCGSTEFFRIMRRKPSGPEARRAVGLMDNWPFKLESLWAGGGIRELAREVRGISTLGPLRHVAPPLGTKPLESCSP